MAPPAMRVFLSRLAALVRRRPADRRLDEEVRAHLELLAAEYERGGMTATDARLAARRAFGGVEPMKERYRDTRGVPWLDDLRRDLRLAGRTLLRQPAFAAVGILTLAVGIGANTALFSAVHDYLWKPLPVPRADELVAFRWSGPNTMTSVWSRYGHIAGNEQAGSALSFGMFERFRSVNRTLSSVFAFEPSGGFHVFAGGGTEFATGYFVSGDFHDAMGATALAGRTLGAADDSPSARPVLVISEAYWQRRFGRDAGIVGRAVRVNEVPLTIVGVVPARDARDLTNRGLLDGPDLFVPLWLERRLASSRSLLENPADWRLVVMGRLRPGVTREQVEANFRPAFDDAARDGWRRHLAALPAEARSSPANVGKGTLVPRLDVVTAAYGIADASPYDLQRFTLFAVIVGIALLTVCVNLASLLLARGAARRRELAVRMAIGASRGRLLRQLLTESLMLGVAGAVAGWPVAIVCRTWLPDSLGAPAVSPDLPVLAFTAVLSIAAALGLSLLPALRVVGRLTLSAGSHARATLSWRVAKPLVVAQVALSLVLLAGAALFTRTLWNLQHVPLGFEADNLIVFSLEPALAGYDAPRTQALDSAIREELRRLPGVRAVGIAGTGSGVLWGIDSGTDVYVEGAAAPVTKDGSRFQSVDPHVFETMGIRLLRGRAFDERDTRISPRVAIVSESFARTFFGGADPIGRRFASQPQAPAARLIEIVGVVADLRVTSLRTAAPTFFRPLTQLPVPSRTVIVRTVGSPESLMSAVTAAMRRVEPKLPLRRLQTQQQYVDEYTGNERLLAGAAIAFGMLSVVVSMVGLFGLMAHSVTQRTQEIGVRVAIGATPRLVRWQVLREALLVVAVGVVLGLAVAVWAGRFAASLVFGMGPRDAGSMAAAVLVMIAVAALAAYVPARRASRVDPIVALRSE